MKVRGLVIPDDFPKSSRTAVWTNEERIRQYLAFLDLLERYNLDNTGFFANDEFSLATIVRMHHAELEEVN